MPSQKTVYCYDSNGEFLESYESARALDKKFGMYPDSFRKHIDTGKIYRERIWSYNKETKINTDHFDENKPKILIFDIETAPLEGYLWNVWKQNIPPSMLKEDWYMLTWSAKWLGDVNIISEKVTPGEAVIRSDYRIVKKLWKLFNEADIIIAHNAKKFDIPRMNSRFLYHDIEPPSPYRMIDTLVIAKRKFAQTYNRLDSLARFLGYDPKIDTDINLWIRSIHGDPKAINEMSVYNDNDVRILEDVYLKLRRWMDSHPNVSLYYDDEVERCHRCGSPNIEWVEGKHYVTPLNVYPVYKCECGGYGRGRKSILSKEKRESLTSSIAR